MTARLFATITALVVTASAAFAAPAYRTYAWVPGTPLGEPVTDARIIAAIDRELRAKKLAPAPIGTAELDVTYHVRVERPIQVVTHAGGWAPAPGPGIAPLATAQEVFVAKLTVELRDAASGAVVWRRVSTLELDPKASAAEHERRIGKAVTKLLASALPSR